MIKLIFRSHGMKSMIEAGSEKLIGGPRYVIPRADTYIDCRGIPDPSHHQATGLDAMITFVSANATDQLHDMKEMIHSHLDMLPSRRRDKKDWENGDHIVLFMCAHGMHRSVSCKHILGKWFQSKGYQVEIQ